jgi:HSP20 family protein
MKPIGIGQITKASKKSKKGSTRHDHPTPEIKKEAPEFVAEQEGQLSVDVYQTENDIVIIAPVAGATSETINISITDDVITIKGRREMPVPDKIRSDDFYIEECFWGNFSRSIVLPAAVDTNNVEAHFKNNVLQVRIPKTERVRTRIIQIEQD